MKLQVKDSGVGIEREEQSLVFNRYFQAKNHLETQSPGTGLGLALTRELVKLMGGEISVQSKVGKGSVFEVLLPISKTAEPISLSHIHNIKRYPYYSEVPQVIENNKDQLLRSALKLLLVEDNPDVIRYLKSLLEEDYNVEEALSGTEGFEKAQETIPDLIISDVMMPGMDGFSLCRKLKADLKTSHIPIVLLTARSDFDSRIEGLSTGADAYLSKPFNKRELFVQINTLIESRKALQKRYTLLYNKGSLPASATPERYSREDAFMDKVRQLLEAHLSQEEFGIEQLCEALAMSRSQLYRKFSALSDMTVNQFIIALRLEKARELLATTEFNVSEVAYDTGFKNPAHFSRVFSERFGYPPSHVKS
jgi:DNA-binding response OmpR family regulator